MSYMISRQAVTHPRPAVLQQQLTSPPTNQLLATDKRVSDVVVKMTTPANPPAPVEIQSPVSDRSSTITPTSTHAHGGEVIQNPAQEPTSEESYSDNAAQERTGGGARVRSETA